MKQHKSFNTHNKSAYQNDFWRSCDTEEDWSNDTDNTALLHRNNCILKYIKQETNIRNSNNISQYYSFFLYFDQINTALIEQKSVHYLLGLW